MQKIWTICLVLAIVSINLSESCFGNSGSSNSGASSSSSSSQSVNNRFGADNGNFQGQSVSVGVQCDSSGNCKKYENSQTWG